MLGRLLLAVGVAGALLGGVALRSLPASAETPTVQASFLGDCGRLPSGSICLEFADGFVWVVEDAITGWGANHGTVEMAYGERANYAHALGTELVWTLAK